MYTQTTNCTRPMCICAGEKIKLIGTIDGMFPDFGHHQEQEMGGLWLPEIKLLDGFWLLLEDTAAENVHCWVAADSFTNHPWKNVFHTEHGLGHTELYVERTQIASDDYSGVQVCYKIVNTGKIKRPIRLTFLARTDLRPVWYSEENGIQDGTADIGEWHADKAIFLAKDNAHEWYTAICSSAPCETAETGEFFGPQNTVGNGTSLRMRFSATLAAGEEKTILFYLAGSAKSEQDCLRQLTGIVQETDLEAKKARRYQQLADTCRLTVPDERFSEIVQWIKFNTDWLILDAGEKGRGLCAGAPEYMWWFGCDNCYALQGVLAMGDAKLCRDTLELILRYSIAVNGNGRVIHEITPAGLCVNPGNTQETAHFVTMLWKYYQWTGDWDFVQSALPYVDKAIAWLRAEDEDNDYFPSGYGIIEIAGLNGEMIDTAVYTCEAYFAYANMLEIDGRQSDAETWLAYAKAAQKAINTRLWDETEGLYCDVYASKTFVRERLNDFYARLPMDKKETMQKKFDRLFAEKEDMGEDEESGWLLNQNWIIATPMEAGIAPDDKAQRALETMHTAPFIGPYGAYLSTLFPESTMTISTGVFAVAQVNYGNPNRALSLLQRMFSTFGRATPGAISEMSPDYGCFAQGWTVYAAMVPIVQGFFGIQPNAKEKRLVVRPQMPDAWTDAKLDSILVLDGEISLHYQKGKETTLSIQTTYTGQLVVHAPEDWQVSVNGKPYTG